jgi:hypothetical protein
MEKKGSKILMININCTISEMESKYLLIEINRLLEHYQPSQNGRVPYNFNALLAESLNKIFKDLTGNDHPNYSKYHEQNCKMFIKQLEQELESSNIRNNIEYYNSVKMEIEEVKGYLDAINKANVKK